MQARSLSFFQQVGNQRQKVAAMAEIPLYCRRQALMDVENIAAAQSVQKSLAQLAAKAVDKAFRVIFPGILPLQQTAEKELSQVYGTRGGKHFGLQQTYYRQGQGHRRAVAGQGLRFG
ncbi:MAG: hypothetical protein GY862_33310 [Gammaproteobacteria bacterium]|nr:hypothetical protein [Gammaproteobacteria bacterium]